ncbi:hypothetical protein RvY_06363-3 [Ramazzottius varieornatus]|uniref:PiggyBac transposable element-derived protein domain-containing protein n=1 Tax=Ramazzottius varieornatus TaxID=947166 RepID=A0A1D1V4P7_RAMVA|nr:hypothetical protein RvY_06363-3 [Ramazzottius varieornatus]
MTGPGGVTARARSQKWTNFPTKNYRNLSISIDTLDQLTGNYSRRRKTCRWPMAFYDLVDISALNAYVIWCEVNGEWNLTLPTRRGIFLQELSKQMMKQQL